MKYWLFQNNQVLGPFNKEQIAQVKGFNAESLVCPEGRKGTDMGDWQRAGVVSELADVLLKSGRVTTATRPAGEGLLPPEPTLRDLAVLGTLQEKTAALENALSQLQEDLRGRDTEISRLKVELATKERALHELQTKVGEIEGRVINLSGLKDELGKDERQIQELSDKLLQTREELQKDLAKTEQEAHQLSDVSAKLSQQERRLQELQTKLERPAGMGGGLAASPGPLAGPSTPSPVAAYQPSAQSQEVPAVFTPINEPIDLRAGTGLMDLSPGATPSGYPGRLQQPLGPEDRGAGRSLRKRAAASNKFVIIAMVLAGLGAAGAFLMMGPMRSKTKAVPAAPVPELNPQPSAPPAQGAQPAAGAVPPPQTAPEPTDPAQAAVDMAKAFVIPGGKTTLSQRLETAFPPDSKSNLSSWMVEKLGEDKFQVNYYTNKDNLVYQFLVRPGEKILQGINPEAMSILNGEAPAKPASGKAKRAAKKKPAARGAARTRKRAVAAPSDRAKAKRESAPAPRAKTAPEATPDVTQQQADDQKSLDELLLPGVPKPVNKPLPGSSKGKSSGKDSKSSAESDISPADQVIGSPAGQ